MALIENYLQSNKKIFFQMGGQGSPWYKELKKLYESNELKDFFLHCFDAINELKSLTDNAIATPFGLHPEKWLKNESSIPSDDYLSTAGVSLVMIQMTQLAYYEQFRLKYPFGKIQSIIGGATGHSQGLISATLLALGLEGEEYYKALRLYMKYITYLGVRAQEVFPFLNPTEEELKLAEELGLKDPAPMVAVLGSEHKVIEELVQKFNEKNIASTIYIGLYNTPSNRILSSHRKSLLLFYKENKSFFEENKIKYIFLRTTCPFHSPYMENSVSKVLEDMKNENFIYDMKDLKIPVYTFANGKDYRTMEGLMPIMTRDLLVSTLHWDLALKPVIGNIDSIIDFGPGKTSQRLSEETLTSFNGNIPVLCLANPKDIKELF
jgi:malonyl CoA-acyl carrier protein transacylase